MKANTDSGSQRLPGCVQAPIGEAQGLKLGLDVHGDRYAVHQVDGNTPQLPACR
jgi:hypothetical protein